MKKFGKFADGIAFVQRVAVEADKMVSGALKGMLNKLDPHSSYIPAVDRLAANELSARSGGDGARVVRVGVVVVAARVQHRGVANHGVVNVDVVDVEAACMEAGVVRLVKAEREPADSKASAETETDVPEIVEALAKGERVERLVMTGEDLERG